MGRSSHGRSSSYQPGRGNPIIGQRLEFDRVPEWQGLFGRPVTGEYGPRFRNDPAYQNQVRDSINRIRSTAEDRLTIIREGLIYRSGQDRQDYLDQAWIDSESKLVDFREQQVLYRHTPLEPVFNQAIASEIYLLQSIEAAYDYQPAPYQRRRKSID